MKNSKRMIAVIAASGLALGTMPGVANAQEGSALLDLGLGTELLGGSIDLGLDLFVGSAGEDGPLTGSLEGVSDSLGTDSLDPASLGTGSDSDSLGTDSLDPASLGTGSDSDSLDTGSLTALIDSIATGSASGSEELGSLSDSLGTGSDSDSLGTDSLDPASLGTGSDSDSLDTGSLTEIFTGSDAGSDDMGSLAEIFTGSSELGSGEINLGSIIEGSEAGGGSVDPATLLALGSLAAGGIAIGLAVSGGVNLPPLPRVNVGLVCNLPPEAIEFLKDNGSMERQECEPVEEQN
ncbi:hypothetical protein G6026_12890 [Dietzia sp. DQ11-38-2]|uniref:hypothetical protein n=1 Tax=Dietzia sp. DQ11-38-2 TaxID=2711155 RepID=UPI0015F816DE|nr:hypothetical protein [Dietzia sp. DQ11-38-2]MBB1028560.1 hypothetical protein [Dietzia sp. DQ11-38-2]